MRLLLVIVTGVMLSSCATWSTSKVDPAPAAKAPAAKAPTAQAPADQSSAEQKSEGAAAAATVPESIVVTRDDITDRPYQVLGDIEVTVNKTTLFHADPTPELVDEKLREKAAEMGADAVILVRYGTVGVSFFSWGSLDGKGRAIAFKK